MSFPLSGEYTPNMTSRFVHVSITPRVNPASNSADHAASAPDYLSASFTQTLPDFRLAICVIFLKGSSVDRSASDKERSKDLPTLKDIDLINDGVQVTIGPEAKDDFMETLQADVEVRGFLFTSQRL